MIYLKFLSIRLMMTGPLRSKQWSRTLSTLQSSLSSADIRNRFLEYFIQENGHQHVKSSPVISYFDPSIPFVNAGMCQFKRIFTSQEEIDCDKAANSQKCIRIAGKHNDLQAVGIDSYHHTFFEMLGNWSFKSYDKKHACRLAWELLTSSPYNIPPQRLFVTYFGGDDSLNLPADNEIRELWLKLGVQPDHIIPFGTQENFWEMGSTGPCGTCTEIHVALTDDLSSSPHLVNKNNPLLTELWNIVFIKYHRTANGTIETLPEEFIDTGMGFERLVALLQGKTSNYDSDLFTPLFSKISKICKSRPYRGTFGKDDLDSSYRHLADFSRMITVAITDNVFPNVNPKLKRILRKALFIAEKRFNSNFPDILITELANVVAESLHETFPEIGENLRQVRNVVENEAKQVKFLEKNCRKQWNETLSKYPELKNFSFIEYPGLPTAYHFLMEQISANNYKNVLPHQLVVNLYITHGLESDVIDELLKPLGLKYNPREVKNSLQQIRNFSKIQRQEAASEIMKISSCRSLVTDDSFKYVFQESSDSGDYNFPDVNATILAIISNDQIVAGESNQLNQTLSSLQNIQPGEKVLGIITDRTNFYTTAGGQFYDTGVIRLSNQDDVQLKVNKVEKLQNIVIHLCDLAQFKGDNGDLPVKIGDSVTLKIDHDRRCQIMKNHTATHLLNAAVKKVFPVSHFKSGSVNNDMISTTFAVYGYSYTNEDYQKIEKTVNNFISEKLSVHRFTTSSTLEVMNLPGITFTPGEQYDPENIHVISILNRNGNVVSRELCCGTHLNNTKYIRDFCITKLSFLKSLSTLIIEAVTGDKAKAANQYGKAIREKSSALIRKVDDLLSQNLAPVNEIIDAYEDLSALLFEMKHYKDSVKDVLPCSSTEDFHQLKALQKRMNKVITSFSREMVATELSNLLCENYDQCDPLVRFFALKHEALRDYEFLLELAALNELTSDRKRTILFITYVDGNVRCLSYVPEDKITENFNARVWLSSVLDISSSFRIAESEDGKLSYSLPKRLPEEDVLPLIESILKKAKCTELD